jgi:soluble lytic murein transglycosylase-like protein
MMRRTIAATTLCLSLSLPISSVVSAGGSVPHPNIPPSLIPAIIKVESRGNPKAESHKGAAGLMQVRWSVWGKVLMKHKIVRSRAELFDPEANVRAGKFVLGHYLRKHNGDIRKALTSYSGGDKRYYRRVMKEVVQDE